MGFKHGKHLLFVFLVLVLVLIDQDAERGELVRDWIIKGFL